MWAATLSAYVPSHPLLLFYEWQWLTSWWSQTALLIGEKCAMLVAEDLGYSGAALDMKVPPYHAPGEFVGLARL